MISEANPVIQEAYHKLEILSQNPDNRREYEARDKFSMTGLWCCSLQRRWKSI